MAYIQQTPMNFPWMVRFISSAQLPGRVDYILRGMCSQQNQHPPHHRLVVTHLPWYMFPYTLGLARDWPVPALLRPVVKKNGHVNVASEL